MAEELMTAEDAELFRPSDNTPCLGARICATYAECERLCDALAVEVASVAEQRGTIEQLIALNAQLRSRLGDEEDYPEFPPALAVQIGYGRTATFTPRGSRE